MLKNYQYQSLDSLHSAPIGGKVTKVEADIFRINDRVALRIVARQVYHQIEVVVLSWRWKKVILPITRLELPGWGRVLRHIGKVGYQHDSIWEKAPKVWIRGKSHGLLMELDLTNWSARNTYFLGRYYELHVLKLLDEILKPGDRFVDIGANVGMISLHAAHLVGTSGQVDCFEPNPECQEAIQRVAQSNSLNHIRVFPFGLSDQAADLELKLNHSHSGIGTLADLEHNHIVAKFTVCVKRGDDVFQKDELVPSLIKIDVEGFEHKVVLGMQRTLDRWGCPIVMELNENHLRRAGTTVQSLHHTMLSMGYTPLRVDLVKAGFKHALGLIPVQTSEEVASCRDVLWMKTAPSSRQS